MSTYVAWSWGGCILLDAVARFLQKCEESKDFSCVNALDIDGATWANVLCSFSVYPLYPITLLIENNADVNLADSSGITPLQIAARRNEQELVELLLKAGANVDACDMLGRSPLFAAIEGAALETVKLLVKHKCDMTGTMNQMDALMLACFHEPNQSLLQIVHFLITECKLDVNGLHRPQTSDHLSPLMIAASRGNVAALQALLFLGADPNARTSVDRQALDYALTMGHTECALALQPLTGRGTAQVPPTDEQANSTTSAMPPTPAYHREKDTHPY